MLAGLVRSVSRVHGPRARASGAFASFLPVPPFCSSKIGRSVSDLLSRRRVSRRVDRNSLQYKHASTRADADRCSWPPTTPSTNALLLVESRGPAIERNRTRSDPNRLQTPRYCARSRKRPARRHKTVNPWSQSVKSPKHFRLPKQRRVKNKKKPGSAFGSCPHAGSVYRPEVNKRCACMHVLPPRGSRRRSPQRVSAIDPRRY